MASRTLVGGLVGLLAGAVAPGVLRGLHRSGVGVQDVSRALPGEGMLHEVLRPVDPAADRRDGELLFTWCHRLTPTGPGRCRLHSRLRIRRPRRLIVAWVAEFGGGLIDRLSMAVTYAGLADRVRGER